MKQNGMNSAAMTPLMKLLLVGFALIVFHPFVSRATPAEIMYDAKRLFACFVLVGSCLFIILNHDLRNRFSQSILMTGRATRMVLAAFSLCIVLVAVAVAEYKLLSLYELSNLIALLFFGYLVTQQTNAKTFVPYIKLLNVLLFLNVSLFFWVLIANGYTPKSNVIFTFMNPRFLNQVQIWLFIPLAAFAFIEVKRKSSRWIARLSLVLAFISIYATDARGAFIAASGGMMLLALLDKQHRMTWLKLWLYSAIVAYVAKFILLDPLPSLLMQEQTEYLQPRLGDSGRIELWQEALRMSTWLGQGSGFFVCHSTTFGHPHNSVLSVLVQWGPIGAICYLALILRVFFDVVTTPARLHRLFGVSLLTGVAYSLVSGVFVTPISQMLGAVTLGFYWISSLRHRSNTAHEINRLATKKVSAVLLVVAVISALSISHRVYERANHYPESTDSSKAKVQFWVGENCV